MEFSDYDGPSSVELEQAWSSLSADQQAAIQAVADEAGPTFYLSVMFGDMGTAQRTAADVISAAHSIAGLPL